MTTSVQSQVFPGLVLKRLQCPVIIAFRPARRVDIDRLVDCLNTVLLLKAIGDNIKLQLAHSTHNHIIVIERKKHLGAALFRQLANTVLQLLGF